MLKRFSVSNYRGFRNLITLDLSKVRDYTFNNGLVSNGCIKDGLIYGNNGSGKSALMMALSDISVTLTDNMVCDAYLLGNFRNLQTSLNEPVFFSYEFSFGNKDVIYSYRKMNPINVVSEQLTINQTVAFDRGGFSNKSSLNKTYINYSIFPELESLNVKATYDTTQAFLKFLARSGIKTKENSVYQVYDFASHFLFFRSVMLERSFTGFKPKPSSLADIILDNHKLPDFQKFLASNGINYNLSYKEINGKRDIYVTFPSGELSFSLVASSGTEYLELLYSWILELAGSASFLCIDEFDSYYHDDVGKNVFSLLCKQPFQTLVTTHHTYLMQNEFARPDCVFLITDNKQIKSLSDSTDRELREAHNIEKMYRNGAFVNNE